MSDQRTAAEQRAALAESLRADITSGALPPGAALPSLRELGERFSLSRSAVQASLEPLIAEGVLLTKPRHGVFVASMPPVDPDDCFVLLSADRPQTVASLHVQLIQRGFERQISQLGGTSLILQPNDLADAGMRAALPDVAGVLYFLPNRSAPPPPFLPGAARARIGYPDEAASVNDEDADWIHFDDLDGGRQAAEHLIKRGHRRIAFMAAHTATSATLQPWSRGRQAGWQTAMTRTFPDPCLLSFHPTDEDAREGGLAHRIARRLAERMLDHLDCFDAVVGADDAYVLGLVEALRAADVPLDDWPTMVGFEGVPETRDYVLTSIVPPWERIGEAAADVLWSRRAGRLQGPPVERLVAMNLVSRQASPGHQRVVRSAAAATHASSPSRHKAGVTTDRQRS